MRLLLQCAALCCAFFATAAHARPFTIDDLMKVDKRSVIGASPDGRWLVITVDQAPDKAPRFDYGALPQYAARRLYKVDLTHPGATTPLLAQDPDAGYTAGAFSPDGQRVLVTRMRGHQSESGVVEMATGAVRWLGVGLDFSLMGRTAQWRGNRQIVAIVDLPDRPHFVFRRGWESMAYRSAAAKATAEGGGPSVLTIGSGKYLDAGAPGFQRLLVRIDVETNRVTALAQGEFLDLEVSSTGRFVAAYKYGAEIQPNAQDTILGGTSSRRRDLAVFDLASGRAIPGCEDCDLSSFLMAWAPRSDRLLVYARRPSQTPGEGSLVLVTPDGDRLATRRLDQVRAHLDFTYEGFEIPRAGWVGETPVAFGRPRAQPEGGRDAWLKVSDKAATPLLPDAVQVRPDRIVSDASGRMLLVGGGRAFRLAGAGMAAFDTVAAAPTPILGDQGRPAMAQLVGGEQLLIRRKDRLIRLTARGEQDLGPAVDRPLVVTDTGWSVVADRDRHGVETIQARRENTNVDLMTLNPQLAAVDFGDVRPISHKGPRGEALTSWIVLPPGWRADHLPPLIVIPYPGEVFSASGPPANARPGAGYTTIAASVLAGHGYAVLYASLPHDRFRNEPAQGLAEEILAVVDAAGAAGLADTRRVALWGHSFGGQAALSAATQSDRFAAIVCTSGIADMVTRWGNNFLQSTPEEGLPFLGTFAYFETGQMSVGAPPWVAPERYIRNSALFQADKITAPVLLAYGDLDEYSYGQGAEMFAALYRQGKDAKLLTFWGEGHVVNAPGNVRRLYGDVLDFLDQAFGEDRPGQPAQTASP
jgi:dipeptidyl aminopeptidase/acylaminoacyl peptidase